MLFPTKTVTSIPEVDGDWTSMLGSTGRRRIWPPDWPAANIALYCFSPSENN